MTAPLAPKMVKWSVDGDAGDGGDGPAEWPRAAGMAAAQAQRWRAGAGRAMACAGPRTAPVMAPMTARSRSEVP